MKIGGDFTTEYNFVQLVHVVLSAMKLCQHEKLSQAEIQNLRISIGPVHEDRIEYDLYGS